MMHLKKYAASFLMLALFLAIGVILWRAAGNLFYLFNFGYIGGAIAFGLALELPLPELKELLARAGFALSHASKFDIIIEYFVSRGQYNVFEINEALFAFDQCLIGA